MKLHDPSFLSFHGEPITGRAPPQLRVYGNEGALTAAQYGAVAHAYKLFRDALLVAPDQNYLVQNRLLEDGTRVRMVSISGRDEVFVWPVGGKPRPIDLAGYILLPRDDAHASGWDVSGKPDSARAYLAADQKLTVPVAPQLHVKLNAGAVDWRGSSGVILTWDHNGNNRYDTAMWNTVFYGTNQDAASQGIYYKGTKINTPAGVSAAAIFGSKLVFLSNNTLYVTGSPIAKINAALARGQFLDEVSPTWSTVTPGGAVASARRASAWHFSPDGSQAAAAFAYDSFGVGTWTMQRMRTEAVPQAKRYLTLTLDGGGNVVGTWSDTAYTTEAFACYIGGVMVDNGVSSYVSGALTFTGKRLWGVDWDADGAELVISCQRSGSGTSYADTTPGAEVYRLEATTSWGVYVGATPLFTADYVMPEVTASFLPSPDTYEQTGAGLLELNYIAVHALDARHMAAVIERLTLSYASPVTGCSVAEQNALWLSGGYANTALTVAPKLQVIMEGSVLVEYEETVDAGLAAPMHLYIAPSLNALRYGPHMDRAGNPGFTSAEKSLNPAYPQIGDWYTENIYEWIYQSTGGLTNREPHNFFSAYPNQISDVLARMYTTYSQFVTTLIFSYFWDTARLGAFNSANHIPSASITFPASIRNMGLSTALVQGLAIRSDEPLHFIASTKETFVNQFFDTITKIKQLNAGTAQTGVAPVYRASAFTRATTGDPFAETDIGPTIDAAVTADGNATDDATFQINPVRVL